MREGDRIPADFDSMIAKIVAWGRDRDEALARLRRALAQSTVVVEGGTTNRSFLLTLLDRPEVRGGHFDNHWLDRLTARRRRTCPHPTRWRCWSPLSSAYDADQAAERGRLPRPRRARRRPESPAEVGHRVPAALPRDSSTTCASTAPAASTYRVTSGVAVRRCRGRPPRRVRAAGRRR